MKDRNAPIGVFDSGIGGLTVLRELHRLLPRESTVYLGDTARVPYGTKSSKVVTRYALNNASLLVERGIKMLVVACNTASAVALDELERCLDIPVLGVIEPGARRAAEATRSGVVGVIGTEATISSGAYQRALRRIDGNLQVVARPCPLFVPLAEEGWADTPVTELVAREYLAGWMPKALDTLILGCTHYPLLAGCVQRVVGDAVRLIDSASSVAGEVARILGQLDMLSNGEEPRHTYLCTDVPERFSRVGANFLGKKLEGVEQVDVKGSE